MRWLRTMVLGARYGSSSVVALAILAAAAGAAADDVAMPGRGGVHHRAVRPGLPSVGRPPATMPNPPLTGAPPMGAAGPPPLGAAGPPPLGAAGPPPIGAAGPPAVPGAVVVPDVIRSQRFPGPEPGMEASDGGEEPDGEAEPVE